MLPDCRRLPWWVSIASVRYFKPCWMRMPLREGLYNGAIMKAATIHEIPSNSLPLPAPMQSCVLPVRGPMHRIAQQSDARVAIVVSQLEQDARRSSRLVKEGLLPGWQNADASQNALLNVSYGQRLAEFPVVATALLALRWLHSDLSSIEVSTLLRSTVLGDAINHRRVTAELRLRQYPDQRWTSAGLLAYLRGGAHEADNDGLEVIAVLAESSRQLAARQTPGQWVELFNRVLEELGWPGTAALSSHEFQTINRWRELLNEFARLELVAESMSVAEALSRISAIAAETVFQPESKSGAVQLLGPLEAAGLEFDELWIVGANSSNWPPQGQPLSLVSRELQRRFDLPDQYAS